MIIKIFNQLFYILVFVFCLQSVNAQTTPTATLDSHDSRFCESGTDTLVIHFTGTAPFGFKYTDGSAIYLAGVELASENSYNLKINAYDYKLPVSQSSTATFTLIRVYDAYNIYSDTEENGSDEVSGSVTIQIDSQPTCDAGDADVICGYSYFLEGEVTDISHDIWWENLETEGDFYNDKSDTTTFTAGGVGTYSLMLHEVNGACRDSSIVDLTFKGRPIAEITSDTYNFCSSDDIDDLAPVEIAFEGNGDYSYVIKTDHQSYDTQTLSSSSVTNYYAVTQSETFVLESVVDNITKCASIAEDLSGAVEAVDLKPTVSAGDDDRVCGDEYVLDGSKDEGNNGQWTSDTDGLTFSDEKSGNATVTYTDLSTYGDITLTWTVAEPLMGCAASDEVMLSFVEYPALSLNSMSDEICEGSESEIEYSVSGNYPLTLSYEDETTSYTVDNISNNTGSFFVLPQNIDDAETLSYDAVYQFTKVVDSYGCQTDYSDLFYTVTVDNMPSAEAGDDQEVCGKIVSLESTPSIGDGIWRGDGSFDDSGNYVTDFESNDFGEQYLTWTETNGVCVSTDDVLIDFQKAAYPVYAGEDTIIYGVDQIQLNATELIEGSGLWTLYGGSGTFEDVTNSKSEVYNLTPGEYQFFWTATLDGAESCGDLTDTVNVEIKKLLVPSGFSPNGDGVNDWFRIYGCSNITANKLSVFDRYGKLVYRVANYDNSESKRWYGEDNNGQELPDGTYYLVFEGKELSKPVKSFLVIKR